MDTKKKWMWLSIGTVLVLVLGLGTTAALAQPAVRQAGAQLAQNMRHGGPGGWMRGIDFDALLADALGISVEELDAARETAHEAAVEQALEEGLLTEEQVELMNAQRALKEYIDPAALTAGVLGISVDDLEAAIADGTTMSELLDQQGLTAAEFREAMQAAHEAAVEDAVEAGVITAEQAEQIQSRAGFGFGRPGGRHGGHGGFGPGEFGPRKFGPGGVGPEGFGPGGFGPQNGQPAAPTGDV